jgi:hypothetical protein
MPTTTKSSKKTTPAAAAGKPQFADPITPLYVNGVERLAELQKKSLDIAAEQSAEWMNAWKKALDRISRLNLSSLLHLLVWFLRSQSSKWSI